MIIQICGTSGSGKTTLAKGVAQAYGVATHLGPQNRPIAYEIQPREGRPLYLLGSYENTCGGVDGLAGAPELTPLIDEYAAKGHVLFEGLLISTYYGKLGIHLERYLPHVERWFLGTDIDVCIQRVKERRLAAGNTKPFNEQNTRERLRAINGFRANLVRREQTVVDVPADMKGMMGWFLGRFK